jgi:hypothetical protein
VKSTQILQALRAEQHSGGTSPSSKPAAAAPKQPASLPPPANFTGPAAWIDGDYKLHRRAGRNGKVTVSLYNLATDPHEKTDLADKEPERAKRMRAALEAWHASVVRSLKGEDYIKS